MDGSYVTDLLPGFLCVGVGLGFSFVPVSIAALAGVTHREAGLASGLINTTQNVGGAVGLAILSTITFTRVDSYLGDHGRNPALFPNALVDRLPRRLPGRGRDGIDRTGGDAAVHPQAGRHRRSAGKAGQPVIDVG